MLAFLNANYVEYYDMAVPHSIIENQNVVDVVGNIRVLRKSEDILSISSQNSLKVNDKLSLRANPYKKESSRVVYNPSLINDPNWGGAIIYNVPSRLDMYGSNSLISELVDEAVYKVSYKWRQDAQNFQSNLAAIFAERKSTRDMIVNNLTSLIKAARQVRRGNLKRAARALGVTPRSRRFVKPDFAGRWLELQYGWLPTLSDLYTLANADIPTRGFLRCSASISKPIHYVEENSWNHYSGYRHSWPMSCKVRATCAGSVEFDRVATAAQFGLTNPALVAWEIVPFSFVADWFLPIGDFLEGLTSLHGLKLTDTSLTIHRSLKGVSVFTPSNRPYLPGRNYYAKTGNTVVDRFNIDRTLGLPSLPLPRLKSPFSVTHGLNALALLISIFRK